MKVIRNAIYFLAKPHESDLKICSVWTSATQDRGLCEKKREGCWMPKEDNRETRTLVYVCLKERERARTVASQALNPILVMG